VTDQSYPNKHSICR